MKTDVIFRRFKQGRDVIALFPAIAGDSSPDTCQSYQHVGQHGAASVRLMRDTVPAYLTEPDTYALKKELEGIGYDLNPVERFTARHLTARLAQIR